MIAHYHHRSWEGFVFRVHVLRLSREALINVVCGHWNYVYFLIVQGRLYGMQHFSLVFISSTVLLFELPRLSKGVSESFIVSMNLSKLHQPLKFHSLCSEAILLHTNKSLLQRIITPVIIDRYLKSSFKLSKDFKMIQFPGHPGNFTLFQIFFVTFCFQVVQKSMIQVIWKYVFQCIVILYGHPLCSCANLFLTFHFKFLFLK